MSSRPEARVGVLARRGRFTVAEPFFERGRRMTVDARRRSDVAVGDLVLVQTGPGVPRGRAELVRSLGRPDVARDVMEALLIERGHKRSFARRVEEDARSATRGEDAHDRRDLRSLPTFTIDPAEARDFDDAVSVERDGELTKLYVHIADVAAHVRPGSPTDAEAFRRGNSVYVPGAVEPMLPDALSSGECSLLPGLPRRAVTVELMLGGRGQVSASSFYRSLIRSDARLTYDEVELVFRGSSPPPEHVCEPLAAARALAAVLRERRLERGALGLETSEPEFEFDSDGHVIGSVDVVQTESHNLIEELMILANEQVAQLFAQGRKPTLYRVHEQPEPAAIEFLAAQLESLEIPTPPMPDRISPKLAGELVGAIGAKVLEHVRISGSGGSALTSLVLRSLKQAYYSPANVGHAGLASHSYCHFTSPIRRYPDLIVHRALLAAVGAGEEPPAAHELSEAGWHCSQTEREAMRVERDADDVCLALLLERDLSEDGRERAFEGEVSGVISAGAFVSFTSTAGAAPYEGFLPARRLGGDFFELNEEATALVGRRSERRLRLGDPVSIKVQGVDAPRGRVDLVPAHEEREPRSRRAGGAARGKEARR